MHHVSHEVIYENLRICAYPVRLEDITYQRGVASKRNLDNYPIDLRGLQENNRVWVLFSHVHKNHGIDEEIIFLHVLDGMGKQVDSFKRTGASVYLYDSQANSTQ